MAVKRPSETTGAVVSRVQRLPAPPGPVAVEAVSADVPRPADRTAKRAWRAVLEVAWGGAPPPRGDVWADVELPRGASLLAPLEVVLDALEPVLGRDPRGRAWQEFFPNDDRIVWLRVRRRDRGLRLRLGRIGTI